MFTHRFPGLILWKHAVVVARASAATRRARDRSTACWITSNNTNGNSLKNYEKTTLCKYVTTSHSSSIKLYSTLKQYGNDLFYTELNGFVAHYYDETYYDLTVFLNDKMPK